MTAATALIVTAPAPTALAHPLISEKDLLADFFSGLTPSSVRAYRTRLTALAAWLGCPFDALPVALLGAGGGPATQLTMRYRGHLLTKGAAPATINLAMSAIRSLAKMARAVGRVDWSVDVKGVRSKAYRDTRGPGLAAIRRLIAQARANPDAAAATRNVAVVRVLHDMALRCNELTALTLGDVELDGNGVPVAMMVMGKGKRELERLTVPRPTGVALAAWLAVRGGAPGPLIGLSNRGVGKLLGRLSQKAGVSHCRPHGLRHTAITEALDLHNGDVRRVREFSRHAKVETLLLYDDNRLDSAGAIAGGVADLL
jgi:integrase/recombinase XerC